MYLFVIIAACILSTGCVLTPPTRELPVEPELHWRATTGQEIASSPISQGWLQDFDSPELNALITEALSGNLDFRATSARVQAARARWRIARSDRFPSFELSTDAARTRRTTSSNGHTTSAYANSFELAGTASWELDLWKRLSHLDKAALAEWQASEANLAAAQLSLAAAVGKAWVSMLAARDRLLLAEQTLESFELTQQIIEDRYKQGVTSALDVHLGRASVAQSRSAVQLQQRRFQEAVRVLEVLLGRYPAQEQTSLQPLPELVWQHVPAGLPAEILSRRPDLIAQERILTSSEAEWMAAKADLLPKLRLTASAGSSSDELHKLLDLDYLVATIAAGLTQPIFNGGELKAKVAEAEAVRQVALADYAQALLVAFEEVEKALAGDQLLKAERELRDLAVIEFDAAFTVARDEYSQGLQDITTLLSTQRQVFTARGQALDTREDRLLNRLDLYLALGGDFAETSDESSSLPKEP